LVTERLNLVEPTHDGASNPAGDCHRNPRADNAGRTGELAGHVLPASGSSRPCQGMGKARAFS
jgi:hypothetical protein